MISFVQALAQAQDKWPALALPPEEFAAYLGERNLLTDQVIVTGESTDLLYLICALRRYPQAAGAALAHELNPTMDAILRQLRVDPTAAKDLKQQMWAKVLLANGDNPPAIFSYQGKAKFSSWVRTVLTRQVVDDSISAKKIVVGDADDILKNAVMPTVDLWWSLVKDRYRDVANQAFATAMSQISGKDRDLLKLYFVRGETIDTLAARFSVHRVTAFRWVEEAKQRLLNGAQKTLAEALGSNDKDALSILKVLHSQIQFRLSELRDEGTGDNL